ncbi:MAG: hypothetical protein L3J12_10370, partial [Spirochaetales bacterium]|nr:hypothetical protein [Spirochaetales bacterium]
YTVIIPYKLKDLFALIMENKMFIEAMEYLYNSGLYEYLSKEESKIWHLSPFKLFDMLERKAKQLY